MRLRITWTHHVPQCYVIVHFLPSYTYIALTVVSAIKLSWASLINQTIITNKETALRKFMIFISLLSSGGLPPFHGFLPKWIAFQARITNNIPPIATIVVITWLITLYIYIYIHIHIYTYIHTRARVRTHTHTHTQMCVFHVSESWIMFHVHVELSRLAQTVTIFLFQRSLFESNLFSVFCDLWLFPLPTDKCIEGNLN